MGKIEDRLTELGLRLPEVVPPLAAYLPALREGPWVYVSGQLPMIDGQLTDLGRVGQGSGSVTPERAKELAAACALNALAAVKWAIGDLDKVTRVVKVVGFVACEPGFGGQPDVVNGASELLGQVFGEAGKHARSAVGVAALPKDVPVEVEMILAVAD